MSISLIRKIKNIFSFIDMLFMAIMIISHPKEVNFDISTVLILILLPLGFSDIIWNKRFYDGLLESDDTLYKKINFSFKSFQIFALILVSCWLVMMIDMLYSYFILGIYPNL